MPFLKNLSISILSKLTGNKLMQNILQKNVFVAHYFMGIGSGTVASSSGEQAIFHVLSKLCTSPYCVFDVGANKGQFLDLALATIPGNEFTIHSFEPGGETFKILKDRKKDDRVTLNNFGIGKQRDNLTLHYQAAGSGLASLTKRNLDHFGIEFDKSETVQIETIDDYCSERNIGRINLLKVDIEGHELDAFAGAKNLFDNGAIDMVTFEFGGCNIDTRTFFQDMWYFFSKVNMKLFRITPSGYLYPIEHYKEIYEQFRTTNFMAIKSNLLSSN